MYSRSSSQLRGYSSPTRSGRGGSGRDAVSVVVREEVFQMLQEVVEAVEVEVLGNNVIFSEIILELLEIGEIEILEIRQVQVLEIRQVQVLEIGQVEVVDIGKLDVIWWLAPLVKAFTRQEGNVEDGSVGELAALTQVYRRPGGWVLRIEGVTIESTELLS